MAFIAFAVFSKLGNFPLSIPFLNSVSIVLMFLFCLFSSSVTDSPPDAREGVSEFRIADKSCRDWKGCAGLLAGNQSTSFPASFRIRCNRQASSHILGLGRISM